MGLHEKDAHKLMTMFVSVRQKFEGTMFES